MNQLEGCGIPGQVKQLSVGYYSQFSELIVNPKFLFCLINIVLGCVSSMSFLLETCELCIQNPLQQVK
jgi:hypothetical protein